MTFLAETGSGHVLAMDGAPEGGGRDLAPRPMEVVLAGTGGCTAYDVVVILRKSGQDIRGCDVTLKSERADKEPRHKMALVFRWYLGQSSRWANSGEASRRIDYQVWCGPAMGAFNEWTKGTYLEDARQRRVVTVALNILYGAAVLARARSLCGQGVPIPPGVPRLQMLRFGCNHAHRIQIGNCAKVFVVLKPARNAMIVRRLSHCPGCGIGNGHQFHMRESRIALHVRRAPQSGPDDSYPDLTRCGVRNFHRYARTSCAASA